MAAQPGEKCHDRADRQQTHRHRAALTDRPIPTSAQRNRLLADGFAPLIRFTQFRIGLLTGVTVFLLLRVGKKRLQLGFPEPQVDLIRLNDALNQLEEFDERKLRIVELKFFAGLTSAETAEVVGVSEITVKREWLKAKAWLYKEITGEI